MHSEFINWTIFTCSTGHFEADYVIWLKTTSVSKKKDNIFREINSVYLFICVYIDVIYSFKIKAKYYVHMHMIFTFFEKYGFIISRKKIKLVTKHIKFLRAEI